MAPTLGGLGLVLGVAVAARWRVVRRRRRLRPPLNPVVELRRIEVETIRALLDAELEARTRCDPRWRWQP